jgi:hypothetical protein
MNRLLVFFLLGIFYLQVSAQKSCVDFHCIKYLLGADTAFPSVAKYIEKNGGKPFDSFNEEKARFKYSIYHYVVKSYYGNKTYPHINRIEVTDSSAVNQILSDLSIPKDYCVLRKSNPVLYPKVPKKQTSHSIEFGLSPNAQYTETFEDCWSGKVYYQRMANGHLIADRVVYQFEASMIERAWRYNPVGWHEKIPPPYVPPCPTVNCVLCREAKTDSIKGLSRDKNTNRLVIDVNTFELDLPFGLQKGAVYSDVVQQMGIELPWEREPNLFVAKTVKGESIYFSFDSETDKLKSISFLSVFCKDGKPQMMKRLLEVKYGVETRNSSGIIYYGDNIYYYGELQIGLPHGYGRIMDSHRKFLDAEVNYFEYGKKAGYRKMEKPIVLSSKPGYTLFEQGIFAGDIDKNPAYGTLYYGGICSSLTGDFQNGFYTKDEAKINMENGRVYIGKIKNNLPNGNGGMFTHAGAEMESGWYVDGYKTGPKHEATKVSKTAYIPSKMSYADFLLSRINAFSVVEEQGHFTAMASKFMKMANSCNDYDIHSASDLRYCLSTNRTYLYFTATQSNIFWPMWEDLEVTLDNIKCHSDDYSKEHIESVRKKFSRFKAAYVLSHSTLDAVNDQLSVPEVQRDLTLAKQMYARGVSSIASPLNTAQLNFAAFLRSLEELERHVRARDCVYSK